MKRLVIVVLLLTALASAIVLLTRPGAEASPATYTVNSTADPGDGTCDGTECTLREAIAAANGNAFQGSGNAGDGAANAPEAADPGRHRTGRLTRL